VVHVLEANGCVSGYLQLLHHAQLYLVLFHVEQVVQGALGHVLEHYVDIRNVRYNSHNESYVGVSEYALHDDFILNFI